MTSHNHSYLFTLVHWCTLTCPLQAKQKRSEDMRGSCLKGTGCPGCGWKISFSISGPIVIHREETKKNMIRYLMGRCQMTTNILPYQMSYESHWETFLSLVQPSENKLLMIYLDAYTYLCVYVCLFVFNFQNMKSTGCLRQRGPNAVLMCLTGFAIESDVKDITLWPWKTAKLSWA